MSTVADRTRAAMDAITSQVDSAPPLPLPPPLAWAPPGVPPPLARAGAARRWGAWLAPLAAAAAVIALAISLVAVRGTPGGYKLVPAISPAGAPGSFPDYYLTFSQPVSDETIPVGLELRSTLTGKTLATLQPPRGLSFAGITGAADDRTFVADATESRTACSTRDGAVPDLVPGARGGHRFRGVADDDQAADPGHPGRHRGPRDRAVA